MVLAIQEQHLFVLTRHTNGNTIQHRQHSKRVLGFGKKATPLGSLKRAYQGALVSRLTSDWMSSQLSADAEIRNSLRKLRDRSRELVRNNPYARQAKRTTQINIVGTGMKFQSLFCNREVAKEIRE